MMHARRQVRSEVVTQAKYAENVLTFALEDISFCASVKVYSNAPKLNCTRLHPLNYNVPFCFIILVYIKPSNQNGNNIHPKRQHSKVSQRFRSLPTHYRLLDIFNKNYYLDTHNKPVNFSREDFVLCDNDKRPAMLLRRSSPLHSVFLCRYHFR